MNELELEFLNMVHWRISYSTSAYEYYRDGVNAFFEGPGEMPYLVKCIRDNTAQLGIIRLKLGLSALQNKQILQHYNWQLM
jgi:hypothetical protein